MITKATHRHKAPKSAYREVGFLIFLTLVPWPFLAYGLPLMGVDVGFTPQTMIGFMVGFGVLTFLLWFVGFNRRLASTLNAIMDSENMHIQVWMNKQLKVWNGKLSINNQLDLESPMQKVYVEKINNNRTLVFIAEGKHSGFYLPQRLAVQPEVKAFFESFLKTDAGKKIEQRNLIEKFINGDEGIVIKAPPQEKTKSISELMAEERENEMK